MGKLLTILNGVRRQFGWAVAGRLVVDRLGARLFRRHVMEVVWLDLKQHAVARPSEGFEFRFLTAAEIHEWCVQPDLELSDELANEAEAGHSLCFAVLDGKRLASYGWYAVCQAHPRHCFGVGLRLPPDVAYMFKGFTHPDYRGQRLHATGMSLALQALSLRGIHQMISTVEWTNEASLRSCDRLGYLRLGRIVQSGPASARRVSIPSLVYEQTGVRFVPAREWTEDPLLPV